MAVKWRDKRGEDPEEEVTPVVNQEEVKEEGQEDSDTVSEERFNELQTAANAIAEQPDVADLCTLMIAARRLYMLSRGELQKVLAKAKADPAVETLLVNAWQRRAEEEFIVDEVLHSVVVTGGPWLFNKMIALHMATNAKKKKEK